MSGSAAARFTFDSTAPADELSFALAVVVAASPVSCSVVLASRVGATFCGQSTCGFGRPLSFVTVNVDLKPMPHGIGDCWMLRYLKVIASATSIVCGPTGPVARMCATAVPRVQLAIIAPAKWLS